MTHIKRLVMHGFKSFANKTEIPFNNGVNTIIGPNGSGKTNIADALCFVLGRLSTKSIRAAKAKNLLFMGTKYVKPAREASVELVFDNSNRTFSIDNDEIAISRIVKHSGSSVYKINNETKTRAEVIELLAQGGIDPYGFNLILQGQIQSIVGMHPEDRRKIIEEVAGISIYEARKLKSLHELEKTESKLKEINFILKERIAYLRNLESEREQALKFKDLELTVKRCKASLIKRRIDEKEKEIASIRKSIDEKTSLKEKIKHKADSLQRNIEAINTRIMEINRHIQHATGLEQETLHNEITNLKAELEGHRVRKENFEHRKAELERKNSELENSIPGIEEEIGELRKKSPLLAKNYNELKKKKQELEKIEEERKNIYTLKTELNALKERIKDKELYLNDISLESDSIMKQIEQYSKKVKSTSQEECKKSLSELRKNKEARINELNLLSEKELENIKIISACQQEVDSAEQIKQKILSMDVCPLCHNKITEEHIANVHKEIQEQINIAKGRIRQTDKEIKELTNSKNSLSAQLKETENSLTNLERELSSHSIIADKKSYLKKLLEQDKTMKLEILALQRRKEELQKRTQDTSSFEQKYKEKLMEIEEISSRNEENLDQTILWKERELERIHEIIKLGKRDIEELDSEIGDFSHNIDNKSEILERKEEEEKALTERFKKLFAERNSLQEEIQKTSLELSNEQNESRSVEEQINYLKIGNAKIMAEKEASEMEMSDFSGIELIKSSENVLEEKLQKSQIAMQAIGPINLRALETYDKIKEEYEKVYEKVQILEQEKNSILSIIEEIDNKKRRTFVKTFNNINELFSNNFSRLSAKGQAFLEIENHEDIFSGGINIAIRMAKGKYFDVTSLSGGEQTLVALSLLFAIQEYRPYHFYIFDEIDAALDKRNSERLSAMLKHYMKAGQYITITHNDALILDTDILYGVSMHDGVSKILSLKLPNEITLPQTPAEQETEKEVKIAS